jgi:hypothetical protein
VCRDYDTRCDMDARDATCACRRRASALRWRPSTKRAWMFTDARQTRNKSQ